MSIIRSLNRCLKALTKPIFIRYTSTNVACADPEVEVMASRMRNRIVWIDLEMTGLEVDTDRILEVGCVITDENLKIISDEFHAIIHQPDSRLEKMNEWCIEHHGKSGLTEASRKSTEDEKSVDKSLVHFLKKYVPKGKCPMAGNSVYMDRLFLRKYLKESDAYMHYRIIDVSSIKEVVRRWKPEIYSNIQPKTMKHRTIDDIKESIEELEFYKQNVFNADLSK